MSYRTPMIPKEFIWRRVHSLTGFFLTLFLIEHLLTNSQSALLIGANGSGFIKSVNFLKELPYFPVLEIVLLGIPFLIHGLWGVRYLWTAEYNSFKTDGTRPSLPQYSRNHAYTWQRLTSWILLIGILAHVIHMRFLNYPTSIQEGSQEWYLVRVTDDPGLGTLSSRLGFFILDSDQVKNLTDALNREKQELVISQLSDYARWQKNQEIDGWLNAFKNWPLKENERLIKAKSFGLVELLMVRDVFKNFWMMALYSIFVLAACFHAFNGLWTFMITWGFTLTARSQFLMRRLSIGLMGLVIFLGLSSIFGTYWFNLKY